MEIKTQIIAAVFTALAGILLGILVVVMAVCYRRRRALDRPGGHGVHYRRHDHLRSENATAGINFGHKLNSRNYSNFSLTNIERIPEQNEDESTDKIELQPKLHQAKWNKRSRKMDLGNSNKHKISHNDYGEGFNLDFPDLRTNRIEMRTFSRPDVWSEEQETRTLTSVRRCSQVIIETPFIPRPIVRPYKSELYEDKRSSTYNSVTDNKR